MAVTVGQSTRERTALTEKILGAFGMKPGASLSGAAAGGTFIAEPRGPVLDSYDPTNGTIVGRVRTASTADYEQASRAARAAFDKWLDRGTGAHG